MLVYHHRLVCFASSYISIQPIAVFGRELIKPAYLQLVWIDLLLSTTWAEPSHIFLHLLNPSFWLSSETSQHDLEFKTSCVVPTSLYALVKELFLQYTQLHMYVCVYNICISKISTSIVPTFLRRRRTLPLSLAYRGTLPAPFITIGQVIVCVLPGLAPCCSHLLVTAVNWASPGCFNSTCVDEHSLAFMSKNGPN